MRIVNINDEIAKIDTHLPYLRQMVRKIHVSPIVMGTGRDEQLAALEFAIDELIRRRAQWDSARMGGHNEGYAR